MSHHAPHLTTHDQSSNEPSHTLPENDQLLSCELCLKSIPLSEYEISEAEDYVAYFCGLECYDVWRKQLQNS